MNIKKKWKGLKDWQKGGVVGGVLGLLASFPFIGFLFQFELSKKYFFRPIIYLNTLITGCKVECIYLYLVYALLITIIFILLGIAIGFILNKIKRK